MTDTLTLDLSPERFVRELWGIAPKDWLCEFFLIQYRPTQDNPGAQQVGTLFYTVEQVFSDWPSIERTLSRLNRAEVRNIHPGVNPRARRPKKRGKNIDVDGYVALWGDIDFHENGEAVRKQFWSEIELLTQTGLRPSVIVESGRGYHVYWLLDKVYPCKEARPFCAGLQDALKISDAVDDPSRVLRMPGTFNLKDPIHPVECKVIEATWQRYPLTAFAGYEVEPGKSDLDKEEETFKRQIGSNRKSKNPQIEIWKTQGAGEGERHNAAKELAGHFASDLKVRSLEAVLEKMQAWNQGKCSPPIDDVQIEGLSKFAWENEEKKRAETGQDKENAQYFRGKEFLPELLSRDVCSKIEVFATPIDKSGVGSVIHVYEDGCFRPKGSYAVKREAHALLDDRSKPERISNVVELVRISKSIDHSTLNPKATELINVKNGMLDWGTGKIFPHDSKHLSTFQINAAWDPAARSDRFDEFLKKTASSDADIAFIEEMMGYLLIPDTSFHKAFAFIGMPGTGKSTLLKLITNWLGNENVSSVPLQTIEENQYAASALFGKLANICTELNSNALEDAGMVKAISSGEMIDTEEKYQARFSFRPFCRLVFSANEFPHVSDRKGAFVARMIFIEFENIFRNTSKEVKKYDEVLSLAPETFPAMLNRAVAGLRRIMEKGSFTQSEASRRLAVDYSRRCNSVLFFFEENCKVGVEGAWLSRRDFYQRYHHWAKDHGLKPVSVHSCMEVIKSIRPAIEETRHDGYPGLKWVNWVNGAPPTTTQSEIEGFGRQSEKVDF